MPEEDPTNPSMKRSVAEDDADTGTVADIKRVKEVEVKDVEVTEASAAAEVPKDNDTATPAVADETEDDTETSKGASKDEPTTPTDDTVAADAEAKAEDANTEAKAEDVNTEDAKVEDAEVEDAKAEDAKAEDAKAEDAKAEDAKAEGGSDATPPKSSTFASTSKGVREFLIEAASTAARDTGTKSSGISSSGTATPEKKATGFGGAGFGMFKAGPSPLLTFASSAGSGFGGGFGATSASDGPAKAKTLLDSVKQTEEKEEAAESKADSKTSGKVLTGEEDEETLFEGQAKVYRFDAQDLKWRERGKGDLKVKKRVNKTGDARFRLLLREPETERILINMSIMQTMSHEISKNMSKQVRVTGVNIADYSQAINAFMILLKSSETATSLDDQLKVAISTLGTQAAKSEKPST